jgi:hypothetical protein
MKAIFLVITTILTISQTQANDLACWVFDNEEGNYAASNWPESSGFKPRSNKHFFTHETVRGTCRDGYAFEMEAFGPGLSFNFDEAIIISCPFVTNFRGTYGGVKTHFSFIGGVDLATYVGPGVCFVVGAIFGGGFGVSAGVLKIVHKDDVPPVTLKADSNFDESKSTEIPEERKVGQ